MKVRPEPVVGEARIARTWAAVERRLDARPPAWRRPLLVAPAAALALAAAVLALRPGAARDDEAPSEAPLVDSIGLPDGSRIAPSKGAQFAMRTATAEQIAIDLESGELAFEVTHVPRRSFTVRARGYEASVLGTRFRVRAASGADEGVLVAVERGRVRVTGPGVDHVLGAGESWSTSAPPEPVRATVPPVPIETARAAVVEPPAETASARAEPQAKELFVRALDARRAGRDREAAAELDHVRRSFRGDPRAGLAAYELGRIRLDALADPAGAAEAFADAIVLSPSAPFREDAEARRVDALDAAGDRARCEEARAGYLARYPSGLHVRRVIQRCPRR